MFNDTASGLSIDMVEQSSGSREARESFRFVVIASALTLILWFIPYAGLVLYPIRLFVTYIHEICHALAAVLTFGWPREIEIYWDTSGVTMTEGGIRFVISSAGYLGATLAGAATLLLSARQRLVRPTMGLAGMFLILVAIFLGGNFLAVVGGIALGAGLVALAAKAPMRVAQFSLSFLAIQCMLNALSDLHTLFWLSVASSVQTDAQNMANATYIPAFIWTLLWSVMAAAILAAALRFYYLTTVVKAS